MAIFEGHGTAWLPTVRALFREYAAELGVDLCFQGFERELAELPGRYAPPAGAILLAYGKAGALPLREACGKAGALPLREAYGKAGALPLREAYGKAGALPPRDARDEVAGCVALRPLAAGPGDAPGARVCEMKRLYVRPAYRRGGVGRRLAEAIVAAGRARGYTCMRLDTLAHMQPAIELYRALGFAECAPYYDNPLPGAVYMELAL